MLPHWRCPRCSAWKPAAETPGWVSAGTHWTHAHDGEAVVAEGFDTLGAAIAHVRAEERARAARYLRMRAEEYHHTAASRVVLKGAAHHIEAGYPVFSKTGKRVR